MKKTNAVLLIVCYLFLSLLANAQTKKQNAEKEFLLQLNTILKSSKQQHGNYNGTMTVDSMFAISEAGILSVTIRYTSDDSAYRRVRMEVSVANISRVAYDLYLILECKEDAVALYESETPQAELIRTGTNNLFHIGIPGNNGYYIKNKLQEALRKLFKYYSVDGASMQKL